MKNDHHTPPITILGISLKGLIAVLTFFIVLLLILDPLSLKQSVTNKLSSFRQNIHPTQKDSPNNEDITATPEMIKEAAEEIHGQQIQEYESVNEINPDDYYYIITLTSGGTIHTSSLTIKPDTVTAITAKGVKTTFSRSSVKKIRRLKIPNQKQTTDIQ